MSFNLRGPGNEKLMFLVPPPHGPRKRVCPHVGAIATRILDNAVDALTPAKKALSPFGMAHSRNQHKYVDCGTDRPYITRNNERDGIATPNFGLLDTSCPLYKSMLPQTADGKAWQYHAVVGCPAVLRFIGDMSLKVLL